jgi:acetyl esterase/lipase
MISCRLLGRSGLAVVGLGLVLSGLVNPLAKPEPAVAATRYLDPMFDVDVRSDVVYGNATGLDGKPVVLRLDLYTPRGDATPLRPAFLFAHFGFFVIGDKAGVDASGWAMALAQRGYVAASINYRLGDAPVTASVDTPTARGQIDAARNDMQTAVRWFRAHSLELGVDADRIAVGGSSAGAVTALGVAIHADDPGPGDWSGYSSAVCTAVSMYGANDPAAIGPNDAGAVFFHGTVDAFVPYGLAVATNDAMVAAGLQTKFYAYPGENHGLTPAIQDQAKLLAVEWLYDHVATAAFPCSPAVARQSGVPGGTQTRLTGSPGRSAVVSVVAVDSTGPGYLQVLPCGSSPGGFANLVTDGAGQTRAGLAVVKFDAQGHVCLFNQSRSHLVADLQGSFVAGALDDVADVRILDTRTGSRPPAGSQTIIAGRPDSTAIVSLVATENQAPGYLQVLPCGATPGGSANLNTDHGDQIRSMLAFVRFDSRGQACVYNQMATHLVVDLQAYIAGGSFDDVADVRLLDTRGRAAPSNGAQTVITGRPDSTAVVSLVATETTGPGYLQVLPCGATAGSAANLVVDAAGQTIGGLAFVRFDSLGTACVFTQTSSHVVVDLQGYLTPGSFDDVPDVRLLDTRIR